MTKKLNTYNQAQSKKDLPNIRSGDTIKVSQKIKEGDKERIQDFIGLVIARKHGNELGGTISVRKIVSGVGVERIFPIHSPTIVKIEVLGEGKARRSKLYYLRSAKGKRAKLKRKEKIKIPVEEKSEIPATE